MMWESNVDKSLFLSADERILLALYLVNQEKSIWWLTGWLGPDYDGKNVYATLSRLAKRQLITASRSNLYEISQLGIAWIGRRFPLAIEVCETFIRGEKFRKLLTEKGSESKGSDLGHGERSDPSLKAVIIDAAEIKGKRRKLIFDELQKWRYGRMSRGVYLTGSAPAQAAVAEFAVRYRLSGYVNLMTIQPAEDLKILADRVFRLTDRNAAWRLLIDRMFEWKNRSEGSQPQTGLRRIRQDFLQMLVTEPGLPPQLLPENYFMNSAIKHIISAQS